MRISDWSSDVCSSDLIGGAKAMRDRDPDRIKIVTIDTEHAAVRDTVLSLEEQGFEPVLLPVDPDGLIVMDAAQAVIDERTALVAGMLVDRKSTRLNSSH